MIEDLEYQMAKTLESFRKSEQQREKDANDPLTDEQLSELVHQVQHLSSLIQNMPAENRILRRLFFPSIFRRENDVADAVEKTFTWIFSGDQESGLNVKATSKQESNEAALRRDMSQSFIRFLRQDEPTFFVTGKAGCGKSTFMKYIAHHMDTEANLKPWAEGARLVIVRLFFWQSDDPFQASIEGFWRSMLFQLLSQCPELILGVFPEQQPPGAEAVADAVEFRASELEAAFAKLLQLSDAEKYRFVFFIDGLDEHEGDNVTHARLANLLASRAPLANVKIVCSFRPYTVFLDVFRETGTIVEFHKLTRSDIASFAKSRFESSLASAKMLPAQRNCVALVDDITTRAEGVFLWAGIAVRALINQALDHDGEEKALRQRLEACPDDLDALFQQMLNRVDSVSHIRRRSNVVLYLAVHNPFESPLNMLVYSWLDGLDWCQSVETLQAANPKDIVQDQYLETDIASCRERVEVVLHQVTRGLLEVVPTGDPIPFFKYRVDLYHRSARDFLKNQWRLGVQTNPFSGASEEAEVYCRLRSLEVKAIAMQSFPVQPIAHEEDSLTGNLRYLFEYTFLWLARCSERGNHAPTPSLRDFESALHAAENRFPPFLLGLMLITEEISWRYHSRNALHKCSFLHLAAYYGQGNFVRSQCGPRVSSTTPRSSDLNLLLSSSAGADVQTTNYLLTNKYLPDDVIIISDHHPGNTGSSFPGDLVSGHGQNNTGASALQVTWKSVRNKAGRQVATGEAFTTVWMVFLRDFANNVRTYLWKRAASSSYPYHLDRDWLERLARVVEAHLGAGADPSVFFVLLLGNPGVPHRVDLYQMLDVFKPENLASIAELLSRTKKWWEGLIVTGLLRWFQPTSPVGYETTTTDVLRNHEWRVLGVRSENGGELMGSFKVRVF